MPQASEKDRLWAIKEFGSIDLYGPRKQLLARGYKDNNGYLIKPKDHSPTQFEIRCANFLCDEWDYAYDWSK